MGDTGDRGGAAGGGDAFGVHTHRTLTGNDITVGGTNYTLGGLRAGNWINRGG